LESCWAFSFAVAGSATSNSGYQNSPFFKGTVPSPSEPHSFADVFLIRRFLLSLFDPRPPLVCRFRFFPKPSCVFADRPGKRAPFLIKAACSRIPATPALLESPPFPPEDGEPFPLPPPTFHQRKDARDGNRLLDETVSERPFS